MRFYKNTYLYENVKTFMIILNFSLVNFILDKLNLFILIIRKSLSVYTLTNIFM